VVERQDDRKPAHRSVVQRKKESSKPQKEVHKKQSKQRNRNIKPQTAKGAPKMDKKSWKQKVVNYAVNFAAQATLVATLNAGLSVAP
jgi:uncharacterized FlaG/YvyC family protein